MSKQKLHAWTREVLEDRIDLAQEMVDQQEEGWEELLNELQSVLKAGTIEALSSNRLTQEELENYLSLSDSGDPATRPLIVDLCRCGYFQELEPPDPNSWSSRRIKTRQVDGKTYVVGY